jgi:hypothetical protein
VPDEASAPPPPAAAGPSAQAPAAAGDGGAGDAGAGAGSGSADGNGAGEPKGALDIGPAEPPKQKPVVRPDPVVVGAGRARTLGGGGGMGGGIAGKPGEMPQNWKETGRNDPCPCGSGKKFKKCHGASL